LKRDSEKALSRALRSRAFGWGGGPNLGVASTQRSVPSQGTPLSTSSVAQRVVEAIRLSGTERGRFSDSGALCTHWMSCEIRATTARGVGTIARLERQQAINHCPIERTLSPPHSHIIVAIGAARPPPQERCSERPKTDDEDETVQPPGVEISSPSPARCIRLDRDTETRPSFHRRRCGRGDA
jgi:hypothetical protein